MKSILIAALLLSTPLAAKIPCKEEALIAEKVLESRYKGVPIDVVLDIASDSYSDDKEELRRVRVIAITAFTLPDWSSTKRQQKEISKFRSDIYLTCIK